MEAILQSTDIKSDKDDEYNDSYRHSVFEIKVYKSLDLTCEIQKDENSQIE